jgi:multidrug efflux pump subunit AcrA (membrane-fusion protein)
MTRGILAATLAALLAACGGPEGEHAGRDDDDMGGMAMGSGGAIQVTNRQAALAGVTFAVAREAVLERSVRAVAMAVPSERGLGVVNTRVAGWVETLHVNETGRFVRAGQPLFALYAPELVQAQEELLLAGRLGEAVGADSLRAAARRRLALWGIADDDIRQIEERGQVTRQLVIRSPFTGHVLEKQVVEGQMIRPGEPLFRIADLSTIWIEPAVFESDIALIRVGQRAEITFDALPGARFAGRVTFVHPTLDARTRTLRVRVEVPNRDLRILPMMYGTVRIAAAGPRGVTVPLTAILPTGTRDLAFVLRGGAIIPTEVVVGLRGDSTVLVADGLAPGDTVVASATFLFDSESQLAAAMAGIMLNMGMGLDMGGMEMEPGRQP